MSAACNSYDKRLDSIFPKILKRVKAIKKKENLNNQLKAQHKHPVGVKKDQKFWLRYIFLVW